MSSVARADGASTQTSGLTRYYAESGTPPGVFLGAGLAGLACGAGVAVGSAVSEEQLFRMLGMLQDPVTGEALGAAPRVFSASASARRPVAGFDLTFSAPKSVSAAWAVADQGAQALIHQAHLRALQHVIAYAEGHVFASRSGKNGVVHEDVRGVVAAAFDHWDSRAGDPQLHTHVVVLNRAQTVDGRWRTLDSRALFKSVVGLSELYNGVLSDYLTESLGWGWEAARRLHSDVPKFEVSGVPEALRTEFSSRSAAIDQAVQDLITAFRAERGRAPNSRDMLRLRQQATLETRPEKETRSLAELTEQWRERATRVLCEEPVAWVQTLAGRNELPLLRRDDLVENMLREAGRVAVYKVEDKRATFSRSNLFAEVVRQLHGVRFASASDRIAVAERTVDLALRDVLHISPPQLAHTPARFRRPDGTSRLRPRDAALYTTQALLDAESRLLAAGRDTTGPRIPVAVLADVAARNLPGKDYALSADQARAVEQIATSGRVLDVLVGPAGTGKSVAMGGLRAAWEARHGPGSVIGLAPSAAAADVLADELGVATDNTAKWLAENARNADRRAEVDRLRQRLRRIASPTTADAVKRRIHQLDTDIDAWSLHPGQLMIVDEASLAGTFALDELTRQATAARAKVLLVGDWAQLSAVTAGGAFGLLVRDRDLAPELADVRRFTNAWEKTASLRLRLGHADAVDAYDRHGRVSGGDRELMLDALFHAWQQDTDAGVRSLMIAADNDTVATLNHRAQRARVDAGQVSTPALRLDHGGAVGVGDLVVTRANNRLLSTGRGWVKNGDTWTITAIRNDGAVTVQRPSGGQVVLPADYARQHLELAYATNAHRAQGRTVDTAHTYVTATCSRELLYVMATRGRETNALYVDTVYDPDPETTHAPIEEVSAADVLRRVLDRVGSDKSATESIRDEWTEQHSISRLWAEYDTIARAAETDRYHQLLDQSGLTTDQLDAAAASPAYGPLLAAFRDAESRGLDLHQALPALVQGRTLADADDVAAVLHGRVDRWMAASGSSRRSATKRIVGLFPPAVDVRDPDMRRALDERRALLEQRARTLAIDALKSQQPWAKQLGTPPAEPSKREQWLRQLDTIAAHRDRWNMVGPAGLGTMATSLEQETERRIVRNACLNAIALARTRGDQTCVMARSTAVEHSPSRLPL